MRCFCYRKPCCHSSFYDFSPASSLVQNIPRFYLCPYEITITYLLLLSFLLKILSAVLLSFVMNLICVFLDNYPLIFVAGAGFLCLNILLNNVKYLNSDNLLKNANLIAVCNGSASFERLRCVIIFRKIVYLHWFIIVFYLILTFALTLAVAIRYSRSVHSIKKYNIALYLNKLYSIEKSGEPNQSAGIMPTRFHFTGGKCIRSAQPQKYCDTAVVVRREACCVVA